MNHVYTRRKINQSNRQRLSRITSIDKVKSTSLTHLIVNNHSPRFHRIRKVKYHRRTGRKIQTIGTYDHPFFLHHPWHRRCQKRHLKFPFTYTPEAVGHTQYILTDSYTIQHRSGIPSAPRILLRLPPTGHLYFTPTIFTGT